MTLWRVTAVAMVSSLTLLSASAAVAGTLIPAGTESKAAGGESTLLSEGAVKSS